MTPSDNLLKQQLIPPAATLFVELTGLRLQVLWHSMDVVREACPPRVLCPYASRKGTPSALPQHCHECHETSWNAAWDLPKSGGFRFDGRCGAANFYSIFPVDPDSRVMLLVQARLRGAGVASRSGPGTLSLDPQAKSPAGSPRLRRSGPPVVSAAAFDRAVALLRLISGNLAVSVQARAHHGQTDDRDCQVRDLPVRDLLRREPGHCETGSLPAASRSLQVVDRMRDFARLHYRQSVGLGDVAAALKMNGAYLSSLFSATAGVTFHEFLTDLRLAEAKTLLQDPTSRACEVACAVGFTSAAHFGRAFKAHTGFTPRHWSEARKEA